MNAALQFVPAVICLLVVFFGFVWVAVTAFFLRRRKNSGAQKADEASRPPVIGAMKATPVAPPRRPWWLVCILAVGLVIVMSGLIGLWVAGFTVGWMGNPPREWSDGRAPELEALLRQRCVPFVTQGKSVGLAVAVVTPANATVMAFGQSSLSAGAAAARGDTLFEIGSITKTFTAIALARAIEHGDLRLEQPVQELLPAGVDLPKAARGVTLRHLTTHTSGFPRLPGNFSPFGTLNMLLFGGDPYAGYTETNLLAGVRDVKLESKPGTTSSYSNFGMTLLGYLLAQQAGTNYGALIQREICRPLDLKDTTVTLDPGQAARFAQGYRAVLRCGPVVFGLRSSPWFKGNNLGGAGALRSSGTDLTKYLQANMRPEGTAIGPALRESHRELFRENEQTAFGMNWVRSRKKGIPQTVIWHNGGTGGFRSFLGFTEDGRVGVLILSNASADVDALALDLLRDLAAQPDNGPARKRSASPRVSSQRLWRPRVRPTSG